MNGPDLTPVDVPRGTVRPNLPTPNLPTPPPSAPVDVDPAEVSDAEIDGLLAELDPVLDAPAMTRLVDVLAGIGGPRANLVRRAVLRGRLARPADPAADPLRECPRCDPGAVYVREGRAYLRPTGWIRVDTTDGTEAWEPCPRCRGTSVDPATVPSRYADF